MRPVKVLSFFIAFLFWGVSAKCQVTEGKFRLVFTEGNHSQGWAMGVVSAYILTDTSLAFTRHRSSAGCDTVIYLKAEHKKILDEVKSIKWDTLEDYYHNYCIMGTSGQEYFLSVSTDSFRKKIFLHHYYLKEIAHVINCLNEILPKNYGIDYMSSSCKQDCTVLPDIH